MRRSVDVEGLSHGALPIPSASRVGPLIATGGVRGVDRKTGEMPVDAVGQAALMFDNLAAIVIAAGGSPESIVKVTVWISGTETRTAINEPWIKLFPNPESRPARHIMNYDLPAGMLVQCDALALASGFT